LPPTFSLDHRALHEGDLEFRLAKAMTDAGSTGSKQTLNGLFYVNEPELFSFVHQRRKTLRDGNFDL
jgi:hypothetical protein